MYKIVTGKDKVKRDTWFTMATEGQRLTRGNAHPLSLKSRDRDLKCRGTSSHSE